MKLKTMTIRVAVSLAVWLLCQQFGWAFYNPHAGRWLNRDPMAEKGAKNLYAFAANSPANQIDPLGLCKVCASGVRYRVPIGALDAFQQGTPYLELAQDLVSRLGSAYATQEGIPGIAVPAPTSSTSSGIITGSNNGPSWLNEENRQANAGDLHSVNFLFFADWEIDECDGDPCSLAVVDQGTVTRHYTDNSPDRTFPVGGPLEHPAAASRVKKAERRRPLSNCCSKTLIYVDAPGGVALSAGNGGRGFGFDQTQNIVLRVYGSGAEPVSTASITISLGVSSDGTLSSVSP